MTNRRSEHIFFSDEIFGPKIKILVKTATNLKNVVKFGTIDPYAEITFEREYLML